MKFLTAHRRASRLALACAATVAAAAGAAATAPAPAAGDAARVAGQPVALTTALEPLQPELAQQDRQYLAARRVMDFKHAQTRERLIEEHLQRLVDEQVLALEARAQQSTPDALLASVQPSAVTDTDARAAFEGLRSQIKEPYEAVEIRLRALLADENAAGARRAYLDGLRAKYQATVLREPLRTEVRPAGPARGAAAAPVTIVEFADFECPYCARLEMSLQRLLRARAAQVRLVFRHLPLTRLHPLADGAARSAVCAERQGRFWELHDWMFGHQDQLDFGAVVQAAPGLGIDPAGLKACLEHDRPEDAVRVDAAAAAEIGLTSTPSLFVNGRFVDGVVPYATLLSLVDDEIARVQRTGAEVPGP